VSFYQRYISAALTLVITNYVLIHHALHKAEKENEMMNHQIHHEKTSKQENKNDMGALFLSRASGV